MKSYRRLLGINWKQRKTNEYIWQKVVEENGGNDPERLMEVIKKRKLKFFGHQSRRRGRMTKVLIQGNVDGIRQRGRPKKNWADNMKEWSKHSLSVLSRRAVDMMGWRKDVSQWLHLWHSNATVQ